MRKIPFAGIELTSQRVRGYIVPLSYRGDRSSIYMSAIGVRLSIKGRILFYWVVFIEGNTLQYSTVVIINDDNALHPMFTPDPCDYSRGLAVFCFSIMSSV